MIRLLFGIVLGILFYISIVHSFMKLEDTMFAFKYGNMPKGFGDDFAFMIDDTIINRGG